jgi:hypothetical protein
MMSNGLLFDDDPLPDQVARLAPKAHQAGRAWRPHQRRLKTGQQSPRLTATACRGATGARSGSDLRTLHRAIDFNLDHPDARRRPRVRPGCEVPALRLNTRPEIAARPSALNTQGLSRPAEAIPASASPVFRRVGTAIRWRATLADLWPQGARNLHRSHVALAPDTGQCSVRSTSLLEAMGDRRKPHCSCDAGIRD